MSSYAYSGQVEKVTVGSTGTYDITAYGAQGGTGARGYYAGGYGAEIEGSFALTAGEKLEIIVGGAGINFGESSGKPSLYAGGGGGGSFVLASTDGGATYHLLIAAGGGGGSAYYAGYAGTTGASGSGAGGYKGIGNNGGGGGSGYNGSGSGARLSHAGGSNRNGTVPYAGGTSSGANGGIGGFGGGGGSGGGDGGGGGGGGYTGGNGGKGSRIYYGYGGTGGTSIVKDGTYISGQSGENSGNGLVVITPDLACFATGTLIRVARSGMAFDVAVEALRVGDRVVTAAGELRPIKWIGHRAYQGRFLRANPSLLPICFKAGSLADNVPARDLWVSSKHAMFIDGVLIAAEDLVNGVSIVRAKQAEKVEYWHVELDSHDVLIAEGAASESFVDDDSRGIFHNARDYWARHPNEARKPAIYCAPRVEDGFALETVRQRIAERAGLTGMEIDARIASAAASRL